MPTDLQVWVVITAWIAMMAAGPRSIIRFGACALATVAGAAAGATLWELGASDTTPWIAAVQSLQRSGWMLSGAAIIGTLVGMIVGRTRHFLARAGVNLLVAAVTTGTMLTVLLAATTDPIGAMTAHADNAREWRIVAIHLGTTALAGAIMRWGERNPEH